MSFVIADRVLETTSAPGTGVVTLLGAATGYKAFSAGIGASNTTFYVIADQYGPNWECGLGAVGAGGTTLTRTTVYSSSNGGASVNFASGTQNVWCDFPAEQVVYNGGPLGTPSSGTLTNCTGYPAANLSGTVANTQLANNAIIFGTTSQALGSTVSSLNGISIGGSVAGDGAFDVLSSNAGAVNASLGQTTANAANVTALDIGTELTLNTDPGTAGKVLTSAGAGNLPTWTTPTTGTVTSVAQSFTGGLISVSGSPVTGSGTLALTVAGTSGGIPYFASGTTWATSAALASNALMIGGGAGAAPSTTTTGTGVITALGVNTGSAGAFVVNGGALGTPSSGTLTNVTGLPVSTGISGLGTGIAAALAVNTGSAGAPVLFNGALGTPTSGTVTNLTGTASININGTVGATTQNSGQFTSITGTSVTDSGLTATRVTYAGVGGLLSDSANMTFDGTGITSGYFVPSSSTIPANGLYLPAANSLGFSTNSTQAMNIDSSGKVQIGTTTAYGKLSIYDATSSTLGIQGDGVVTATLGRHTNDTSSPTLFLSKSRG